VISEKKIVDSNLFLLSSFDLEIYMALYR